ncbi:MAG: M56 family metallopeptidase [Planctomycetota bacterium]
MPDDWGLTTFGLTTADVLWRGALAVVPLALIVGAICRWVPCRPATRHTLWCCVLASLLVGLVLPSLSPTGSAEVEDLGEEGPSAASAKAADATALSHTNPHPQNEDIAFQTPNLNNSEHQLRHDHRVPTPPWTAVRTESDVPTSPNPADDSVGLLFTHVAKPHVGLGLCECIVGAIISTVETQARRLCHSPEFALENSADDGGETLRSHGDGSDGGPTVSAATVRESAPVLVQRAPFASADRLLTRATLNSTFDAPVGRQGPSASVEGHGGTTLLPHADSGREAAPALFREGAIPGDGVAAEPTLSAWARLGGWLAGLLAIRDRLGALPVVPPSIWAGGILFVLAARVFQVLRWRRRVSVGLPAPASVTRMVAEAAEAIGLRNVPRTVMVGDRISPMIWCGRGGCLVLPLALWSELDETGRRAVVFHELAHLRRRDHLICWMETLIGAIYWWHPLVWWVRGRLREEAENCCDAWVTWLLPRGRRSYAEALLQTRQFVSEPGPVVLSAGMGVYKGRTKRLARRITMVMTEQMRPNHTVTGVALALAVVVAGWVATPARSSEPGDNLAATVSAANRTVSAANAVVDQADAVVAEAGERAAASANPATAATVALAVNAASAAEDDDTGRDKRKKTRDDLEARIERLEKMVQKMSEQMDKVASGSTWVPAIPEMPKMPAAPEPPEPPKRLGEAFTIPSAPQVPPPSQWFEYPEEQASVVRTYKLPEGRLEALVELMVRDDIPTRVKPVEGGIEVYATEADQATFKAFVEIITMGDETEMSYRLPEGKLKALTELMTRDDVPVMVAPGEEGIEVHGGPAVQAVFKAFVDMIHPPKGEKKGGLAIGGTADIRARAYRDAQQQFQAAKEQQVRARLEAVARAKALEEYTLQAAGASRRSLAESAQRLQVREHLRRRLAELERKLGQLEDAADTLEDAAAKLHEQAEDTREKASETKNRREATRLRDQAEDIEAQAEKMEQEARRLSEEAEHLEREAEELEEQAADIEEEIEEPAEEEARAEQDDDEEDDDDEEHEDDEDEQTTGEA